MANMQVNTDDLVTVSEANRRGISWLVNRAAEGRTSVVMRSSKPVAAVVGVDRIDRLERLDELEENLRLWAAALVREATDTGARHDLDDVIAELGISLD